MKSISALAGISLLFLVAGCGKGERSAERDAAEVADEAERAETAEDSARPDPATCEKTAQTTLDIDACLEVRNEVLADSIAKVFASWKSAAPGFERSLADKVGEAFEAFVGEEAQRAYWASIGGTIRGTAGELQEKAVRHGFVSVVDSVLLRSLLREGASAALDTADAELNRAYRGDLARYAETESPDNVRGYNEHARAAQRHWIRYRDAWAELATARFAKNPQEGLGVLDPEVSMRLLLTRLRVREICTDPVGPVTPVIPAHCPCWVPGDRFDGTCGSEGGQTD